MPVSSLSLWLHPLHISSHGHGPIPLRPTSSEALPTDIHELVDVARKSTQMYMAGSDRSSWRRLSKHQTFLERSEFIVLGLDGSGDGPWQIPLQFAEVAHFTNFETFLVVGLRENAEQQVISNLRGPFGQVWIINVAVDESLEDFNSSFRALLSTMGVAGVVRSDLDDAYEMSESPVGGGGCSTVYVGRSRVHASAGSTAETGGRDGEYVAIKVWSNDHEKDAAEMAMIEAEFLTTLSRHPNIIAFHGLFKIPDPADSLHTRWAMILEYCADGDLHDYLTAHGPCSEYRAAELMFGMLFGISHLHQQRIVHRDVKSENVLLTHEGRPVVSDLGIAAHLDDEEALTKRCGSPGYCAPEILNSQRYDAKVDVFSAGVVLYFVLSGNLPFAGSDVGSMLRRTLRCRVRLDSHHFTRVSFKMKSLIMLVLQKDVKDRPDAGAALQYLLTSYPTHLREHSLLVASYRPQAISRVLMETVTARLATPMHQYLQSPASSGRNSMTTPTASTAEGGRPPVESRFDTPDRGSESWRSGRESVISPDEAEDIDMMCEDQPLSERFSHSEERGGNQPVMRVRKVRQIAKTVERLEKRGGMVWTEASETSAYASSSPPEQKLPQKPPAPMNASSWRRKVRNFTGHSVDSKQTAQNLEAHNARNPEEDTSPQPADPWSTPVPPNARQQNPLAIRTLRSQRYRFANQERATESGIHLRRVFVPLGNTYEKYKRMSAGVKKDRPSTKCQANPRAGASSSDGQFFSPVLSGDERVDEIATTANMSNLADSPDEEEGRVSIAKRFWESWCSDASGRGTRISDVRKSSRKSFSHAIEETEDRDCFARNDFEDDFSKGGDAILGELPEQTNTPLLEGAKLKDRGDDMLCEPMSVLREPAKSNNLRESFQMRKLWRAAPGMLGWRQRRGREVASDSNGASESFRGFAGDSGRASDSNGLQGQRATFSGTSIRNREEMESTGSAEMRSNSQEPQFRYADD